MLLVFIFFVRNFTWIKDDFLNQHDFYQIMITNIVDDVIQNEIQ